MATWLVGECSAYIYIYNYIQYNPFKLLRVGSSSLLPRKFGILLSQSFSHGHMAIRYQSQNP